MHKEKQKVYNPAIDVLRIISILAVVCIHTTTKTIQATSNDLQHVPWTLLLNQAARFAVPLFFMISGFVLELNYTFHANYFVYLKKRLSRILIPYIFWSAIYFFVIHQSTKPYDFLRTLIAGTASYQLYFIPALLMLYLIFPLIHRYYNIFANRLMVIILGIVQVVLLGYDYYIHPLPFFIPLSVVLLNYYIFILGMIAAHHQQRIINYIHKWRYLLLAITGALLLDVFLQGDVGYMKTHNYLSFYSQWRPSVLVYTVLLGGLLYYFSQKKIGKKSAIQTLSRLSFFVFFVHVIILEFVWDTAGHTIFQQIHPVMNTQIWFDVLFFAFTAGISFLLAYMAQKIPLLRNISG